MVLFLMIDAKLWRFPVLDGLRRIDPPKLSKHRHAPLSSGCVVIFLKRLDNRVAQAGLADLGMCLIRPPEGEGCVKTGLGVDVVDIDEAMTVDD